MVALVTVAVWTAPQSRSTSAATLRARWPVKAATPSPPNMVKLLHDDAAGLNPDFGSYTNVGLEQGIGDFVGSAPGTFANDFAGDRTSPHIGRGGHGEDQRAVVRLRAVRRDSGCAHDPGAQLDLRGSDHDPPVTVLPAHPAHPRSVGRHLWFRYTAVLGLG